jgi:cytochrome c-type biogenesis protein CcmH/NrfG
MPRSINSKVPESVERVLLKALSKERVDRYAEVPQMAQAFKAAWESAGVPMKGTALTLPPVTARQERKADTVQRRSTAQTDVAQEPKKKRSPWLYVAGGALLTVCCVVGFFAFRQNRLNQAVSQPPEVPPTQVVDVPPPEEPTPELPEPLPPEPPEDMPPEIREARRNADANPDNPVAQLELALALWDADMQRPALETLNHAADLGTEDVDFLIHAGNEFHAREAWIASAAMYLRVQKRIGIRGDVPEEIITNFHEAVYKAAPNPELEVSYPLIEEIMRVDQPIGLVAQARHAFYNGRFDDAQVALNQAKQLAPNMFEVALLEAEMDVIEERFDAAKLRLQPLMADLNAPEWIRIMAEVFFVQIP